MLEFQAPKERCLIVEFRKQVRLTIYQMVQVWFVTRQYE